jgi:hypothetical protein
MVEIIFDMSAFEKEAKALGGALEQVPFALSKALNRAALETRSALITDTWPSHVHVRNPGFLGAALRTNFSSKNNLQVEIYDRLGRASLVLHNEGGTKTPRGSNFAIPIGVQRGARGVPKGQRPQAIIAKTPKRALRITNKGIFIGADGVLHLVYAFSPSTNQPADVPFDKDFARYLSKAVESSFPEALLYAMLTAK